MRGFLRLLHAIAASVLVLGLAGCAELGWNPLDPKEWSPPPMPLPARQVVWGTPALDGREPVRAVRWIEDTGSYIETYRWTRASGAQAQGALRLSGLEDPAWRTRALSRPVEVKALWPDLDVRSLQQQGEVYVQADPGRGGDWFWQRALLGPELCVLFARAPAAEPDGMQAGFFCQGAGEPLSEAQAAGVVEALSITPLD